MLAWLMPAGVGGVALLILVFTVLPESIGPWLGKLLIGLFVAGYVAALSRGMQPEKESITLRADLSGLHGPAGPIALRAEIVDAYVRPAVDAASVRGVSTPAWPLTVEVITRTAQLNLDTGGEAAAQQVLGALGIPPRMVAPTYIANSPANRRMKLWGYAGIAVMLLASLVAALSVSMRESPGRTHHGATRPRR
jgi:hypothetical protein